MLTYYLDICEFLGFIASREISVFQNNYLDNFQLGLR